LGNNRAMVVISMECKPEDDGKFNDWYDTVHIPMAMKYEGMRKATRYSLRTDDKKHSYLTVFEFRDSEAMKAFPNSPEVSAAREEMAQRWKGNIPFEIKWRNEYELIHTWDK
jgi:antibiotic biosynthesis monooxygenase (ABM) superfamily enzyme